ncbi:MAG: hypothetical protein Q9222_004100 [Ikaeria aurantiellina]
MAAPSRRYRNRSDDDDDSSGPHVPPPPHRGQRSDDEGMSGRKRRRRSRYASGYDLPQEKSPNYSRNGVACQQDDEKFPNSHTFTHACHHPERIRRDHEWVDWFTRFKDDNADTVGLEFVEGLWAEKLVAIALTITFAIIVVLAVWVARGGDLQTVFTVMGFVLTGAAGRFKDFLVTDGLGMLTRLAAGIALVALYYEVNISTWKVSWD